MRRTEFNDGEGIIPADFNKIHDDGMRALARFILRRDMRGHQDSNPPDTAFFGTPRLTHASGGNFNLSGTGLRTITFIPAFYLQDADSDGGTDVGIANSDVTFGEYIGGALVLDAPTSGSVHRRDIIEAQINGSDTLTGSETRVFEDAATRALTEQSVTKVRYRGVTYQIKKGTDQASEASADAAEPAPTAGWQKIWSFLVPPTGNMDINKAKNWHIGHNFRHVPLHAFEGPALSGAHNSGLYWAASGAAQSHYVPIPVRIGERILGGYFSYWSVVTSATRTWRITAVNQTAGAITTAKNGWTFSEAGAGSAAWNGAGFSFFTGYPLIIERFNTYFFEAVSGASGDRLLHARLYVDEPYLGPGSFFG